uniref:Ribonuclease A-domain domain-containing protein n=1 Tax=Poecilia reticulata TaxID=8081 RepID=A0A3P9P9J2_POERE
MEKTKSQFHTWTKLVISEALNFFQKHVVTSMDPQSCDTKMKSINAPERECKPKNTFFLDPKGVLNGICNFGNSRQTKAINLKIIVCKCENINEYPNCKYKAVEDRATSVTVLCDQNGVPSHAGSKSNGQQ